MAFGEFEYLETGVDVFIGMRSGDLSARTADALFGDFGDVQITCFIRFGLLIGGFGQLDADTAAAAAVFGIELHHGVGGGGGA